MSERRTCVAAKAIVSPAAATTRTFLMRRVFWLLFLTLGSFLPASAEIIGYTSIALQGTGHGTVNEVLTFGNVGTAANNYTASGCVWWNGTASTDGYGGCPYVFAGGSGTYASMQTNSMSHTILPTSITPALTDPFSLAIVFDASEPGGTKADLYVQYLTLAFYAPNASGLEPTALYTASLMNPAYIPGGTSGSGGSGQTFGLSWDQAVAAQNAINLAGIAWNDVRIGLGAGLTRFDGHGYFWIVDVPGLVVEPEPATMALIGGGLLLLGFLGRRFRRR